MGQLSVGLMVKPPGKGDASYETYQDERGAIMASLKRRASKLVDGLNALEGVSCNQPQGAMYAFPKLDIKKFNLVDDQQLVLDLLLQEKILLVQGTAFNWPEPDHVRVVFLPHLEDLSSAMDSFERFLHRYRQ